MERLQMRIWNSVENNGLLSTPVHEGIGINGIRERLEDFEGTLQLFHSPDGFNVVVSIPKKELSNAAGKDFNS
jgi:signal transduction histidine kinase